MPTLVIKQSQECRLDELSLGEVVLRLDPGEGRVHTARSFRVWEGGGEYNVARGLRRCFGLRTGIVTRLVDNAVGRLLEDLMLQGGVDLEWLSFAEFDGVGRTLRNGLNFTERRFGPRAALGCSDRGHTAVSELRVGDIDFAGIFSEGVRWFHTGGVFAALSENTALVAEDAMREARQAGTCVSYDLNYRPSLWNSLGGQEAASRVNQKLVAHADVAFGNEEDFSSALGFGLSGVSSDYEELPLESYRELSERVMAKFPNLSTVAITSRTAQSASVNAWGAAVNHQGAWHTVAQRDIEILDRVGGGDSFVSGFIYGLLAGKSLKWALRCGVAHGALAMSTAGDTSMASLDEVLRSMKGKGARISR